ncbi:hypothetical protein JXI42_13105 [bacterium]|nr:hypothetical protein [bacterium]
MSKVKGLFCLIIFVSLFSFSLLNAQYGASASYNLQWKVIESGGNEGDDVTSASYRLSSCVGQPTPLENEPSSSASFDNYAGFRKIDLDLRYPFCWFVDFEVDSADTDFIISWAGIDTTTEDGWGWGVWVYDIQYSIEGGAWTSWLDSTYATIDTFTTALMGSTYNFRIRAWDLARNVSPWLDTVEILFQLPSIQVVVQTDPIHDSVWVDGVCYASPCTLILYEGSLHELEAKEHIDLTDSTRYRFDFWSDGEARIHNVTIGAAETTFTAYYTMQYRFAVYNPTGHGVPDPAAGEHWYDVGALVPSGYMGGSPDGAWYCVGFLGTGSLGDGYGTVFPSFIINVPTTLTWQWEEAYDVDTLWVFSPYGFPIPNGMNIFPDGFELTAYVEDSVFEGGDWQYCTGWWGSGSVPVTGSANSVTFTITEYSMLVWIWNDELLWPFVVVSDYSDPIPPVGIHWFADGALIRGSVPDTVTGRNCVGYDGWGSLGDGFGTEFEFNISEPSGVEWLWSSDAVYLDVTSPYGTPNPPVGRTYHAIGSEINANVDPIVVDIDGCKRYVCVGWIGTGSVAPTGDVSTTTFTINVNSTIDWQWEKEFYLDLTSSGVPVAPSIDGDGWYGAGSTAVITTDSMVTHSGTTYVFIAWHGGAASIDDSLSDSTTVTMDTCYSIDAEFCIAFQMMVQKDPLEDLGDIIIDGDTLRGVAERTIWVLIGSNHTIAVTSPDTIDTMRYVFDEWSTGEETIEINVTVTSDTTFIAYYITQFKVVIRKDPDTNTLGWLDIDHGAFFFDGAASVEQTFWWTEGTMHDIEVSAFDNDGCIGYEFDDWSNGVVNPGFRLGPIDGYLELTAFYLTMYKITIVKEPRQIYGNIYVEDSTYHHADSISFWGYMGSVYQIAVSLYDLDTLGLTDTLYTFDHWDDGTPTDTLRDTEPVNNCTTYTAHYNVTEALLAVCMDDTVWYVGMIDPGNTRTMAGEEVLVIENCGTIEFDLGLKFLAAEDSARGDPRPWVPSYTTGDINKFGLYARFDDNIAPPGWFHPQWDLIKETDLIIWATDIFYGPGGFDILPADFENLWFQFVAPASSSFYERPVRIIVLLQAKVSLY